MEGFRDLFRLIISFILICCCFFINTRNTYAESKVTDNYQEEAIKRSLESLRDLDDQTWQLIVYPSSKVSNNLILRIVGYPGYLRIDHPTNLLVNVGRKELNLLDITAKNKAKFKTLNDSIAEFDINPLISELQKNRPLRFNLHGLINDLPIPPYLVGEWRSLAE